MICYSWACKTISELRVDWVLLCTQQTNCAKYSGPISHLIELHTSLLKRNKTVFTRWSIFIRTNNQGLLQLNCWMFRRFLLFCHPQPPPSNELPDIGSPEPAPASNAGVVKNSIRLRLK